MAVICAYIRTNAPLGSKDRDVWDIFGKNHRVSGEFSQWITRPELHIFRYNQLDKTLPPPCPPLRTDIQAGLSVMGRRSTDKIALKQTQDFALICAGLICRAQI